MFWFVVSKAVCFHLSMSAPCFHVRKMRRSAERRFVRHVCLRNPCLLWNLSLHSLPEAWGPWERQQHAPPAHYGLRNACQKISKDRVVVSKMWTAGYWLRSRLYCIATPARLMKTCRDSAFSYFEPPWVGSWAAQPFSATCLSEESMPFVKSKPPLPEAWGPWERQHAPPAHYGCIMLAKDRVVVSKMWTAGNWLWSRLYCIATPAS